MPKYLHRDTYIDTRTGRTIQIRDRMVSVKDTAHAPTSQPDPWTILDELDTGIPIEYVKASTIRTFKL